VAGVEVQCASMPAGLGGGRFWERLAEVRAGGRVEAGGEGAAEGSREDEGVGAGIEGKTAASAEEEEEEVDSVGEAEEEVAAAGTEGEGEACIFSCGVDAFVVLAGAACKNPGLKPPNSPFEDALEAAAAEEAAGLAATAATAGAPPFTLTGSSSLLTTGLTSPAAGCLSYVPLLCNCPYGATRRSRCCV
jgi:hypothetical protein